MNVFRITGTEGFFRVLFSIDGPDGLLRIVDLRREVFPDELSVLKEMHSHKNTYWITVSSVHRVFSSVAAYDRWATINLG